MSGEEDMFAQTQQVDEEAERENVYLELEKALTERKCRIIQKKEKIKLLINKRMKQYEQLKTKVYVRKSLKKDIEEVNNQRTIMVQNIDNNQKSISTLEITLCDLTNKVSEEKLETKRMKDEFDAAIKDANDTWAIYKEKYENFPLAKKLREVKVEIKKVEIALKQAIMDTSDYTRKKILKREITERKFQMSVVQLAEKYKLYHQKVAERKELLKKISSMKQIIGDIKSGKSTTAQLGSTLGPIRKNPRDGQHMVPSLPEVVQFTRLSGVLQAMSPPANDSETASGGNLYSWSDFLGVSTRSPEKSAQSLKSQPSSSVVGMSNLSRTAQKLRVESQKEQNSYCLKSLTSSLKLDYLLKNLSGPPRKPTVNVGMKRCNENNAGTEISNKERPPIKKSLVSTPQNTKGSQSSLVSTPQNIKGTESSLVITPQNTKGTESSLVSTPQKTKGLESGVTKSTVELIDRPSQPVNRKDLGKDIWLGKENKENTDPKYCINSSDVKSLTSSETGKNRYKSTTTPASNAMHQNLRNILSMKGTMSQKNAFETIRKDVHEQKTAVQKASTNVQVISQRAQQNNYNEVFFQNNKAEGDRQDIPIENIPILVEPRSPAPDLIPVENNSNSQPHVSQTCSPIDFNLSGGSDFPSPVDDQSKLVYQQLVSGEPYPAQDYSMENTMNNHKANPENVVRSQYFSTSPTLNTPPDGSVGDYQRSPHQPFSPPNIQGEFDSNDMLSCIQSPPPGNTADFTETVTVPSPSPMFNFMPERSKATTNKTFLDLF